MISAILFIDVGRFVRYYIFYLFKSERGWRKWYILVVYFLNKIKVVTTKSCHHVKLIILNDLMSRLVHYILQLFYFDILNFISFILIFYVLKIYHFDYFWKNLKLNKMLTFLTKNEKNDQMLQKYWTKW